MKWHQAAGYVSMSSCWLLSSGRLLKSSWHCQMETNLQFMFLNLTTVHLCTCVQLSVTLYPYKKCLCARMEMLLSKVWMSLLSETDRVGEMKLQHQRFSSVPCKWYAIVIKEGQCATILVISDWRCRRETDSLCHCLHRHRFYEIVITFTQWSQMLV